MEIYKKHRPKSLDELIGQPHVVQSLSRLLDKGLPHAILLSGPSGVGKTTVARIIAERLGCSEFDCIEMNCADFKGIDTIRDIRRTAPLVPMGSGARIWIIDEAHKLTPDAQHAFLKLLEDAPTHSYFILCTTDPQRLIRTIHTRCTEFVFRPLAVQDLVRLMKVVLQREKRVVEEEVLDEIAQISEGSARKALVVLEQVWDIEGTELQLEAIRTTVLDRAAVIDLARLLFKGARWQDVAQLIGKLKDEDPEGMRLLILSYAKSVLLSPSFNSHQRAATVIQEFSRPLYDTKLAGLALACWNLCKRG